MKRVNRKTHREWRNRIDDDDGNVKRNIIFASLVVGGGVCECANVRQIPSVSKRNEKMPRKMSTMKESKWAQIVCDIFFSVCFIKKHAEQMTRQVFWGANANGNDAQCATTKETWATDFRVSLSQMHFCRFTKETSKQQTKWAKTKSEKWIATCERKTQKTTTKWERIFSTRNSFEATRAGKEKYRFFVCSCNLLSYVGFRMACCNFRWLSNMTTSH